ncbi:MAG: class IIb bacteriocin, lactobin A/cerein 7B family [Bacteroidota bacterium]
MSFGSQAKAMSFVRNHRWSAPAVVVIICLALTGQPVAARAVSSTFTPPSLWATPPVPESELAAQLAMAGWGEPLSEEEMESVTGGISPVLLGAGLGALSGGISYGLDALRTGAWDWGDFASNVGSGALGGASAGLIPGSSALAETARTVGAAVIGTVSGWVADWFGW